MIVRLYYRNIRNNVKKIDVAIEGEGKKSYDDSITLNEEQYKKAVEIAKKSLNHDKKTYKDFSSYKVF